MAEGRCYRCTQCQREIGAWSDGNPYYLDDHGKKRYAYHPDHANLARCIGNDDPHLCLECGATTKIDSRRPRETCRRCKQRRLVPTFALEGEPCPYCKLGVFRHDPTFVAVS